MSATLVYFAHGQLKQKIKRSVVRASGDSSSPGPFYRSVDNLTFLLWSCSMSLRDDVCFTQKGADDNTYRPRAFRNSHPQKKDLFHSYPVQNYNRFSQGRRSRRHQGNPHERGLGLRTAGLQQAQNQNGRPAHRQDPRASLSSNNPHGALSRVRHHPRLTGSLL